MNKYLHELARRKDLLLYLVVSGLKAQHRNTILGYFWWLLDPLLGVLIYYFVVVIVFKRGGDDY
ncbi:MAG TPA: ABC transporter permease, partial [Acidobacteriota bacterium]|nr:ABC transporter permease [Acidobacteriota bacterium]